MDFNVITTSLASFDSLLPHYKLKFHSYILQHYAFWRSSRYISADERLTFKHMVLKLSIAGCIGLLVTSD